MWRRLLYARYLEVGLWRLNVSSHVSEKHPRMHSHEDPFRSIAPSEC